MKIPLEESELKALEQFVGSGANYVKVIAKIFNVAIEDLKNIENVDPKGNMGLQTLSRQDALKTVREVRDTIFPALAEDKAASQGQSAQKKSQWR